MLNSKNHIVQSLKCLIVGILILTSSCQSKKDIISEKIIGNWAIDEFEIKNKDCKDDLLINYFSFREGFFSIPEIYKYPAEDEEDNTRWNVQIDSIGNIKLIMICENPIFKNSYQVRFFKNYDRKSLGIELKSNTTRIVAYKALQSFDYNGVGWEE
ncbi:MULTISPECIES: hypothetical protein [unclassified Flavobacterium]|uniref:hypothetical protein n=1 Tax=unclassified Flavobacterium TaxID=196869 RepID=UPI00057F77C0|nr:MULTISPECIES: hypothetical protein [unclassified Flavobacterium]KIA91789.1 hypothetical protein OA93_23820 [Flavobacterium sp. KMS]OUL60297.1 hypothetical protein B8T70_21100 [Flavobacterium sp. AJR]